MWHDAHATDVPAYCGTPTGWEAGGGVPTVPGPVARPRAGAVARPAGAAAGAGFGGTWQPVQATRACWPVNRSSAFACVYDATLKVLALLWHRSHVAPNSVRCGSA